MKKQVFNIVVKERENVLGGPLATTEPMTEKQAMVYCQKKGREFLQNNECDDYALDVCTEDGEMVISVESLKLKRGNWVSTDYKVWDYRTDSFILDTASARRMRNEIKNHEQVAKAEKAKEIVESMVKVAAGVKKAIVEKPAATKKAAVKKAAAAKKEKAAKAKVVRISRTTKAKGNGKN